MLQRTLYIACLLAMLAAAPPAFAQAPDNGSSGMSGVAAGAVPPQPVPAAPAKPAGPAVVAPEPEPKVDTHQPFRQSFFFSGPDMVSILTAMKGIFTSGGPLGGPTDKAIPQVRTLRLSGILFKSPDQWMIWLNGQKVTPFVRPRELVDIQVEKDTVHMKWFDIGLNGVITITMHPHQLYDIVTGIMVPDEEK